MSKETLSFLNNNTLIGFTDKRGNAWHRDLSLVIDGLDNHYPGAIPVEDIRRRLFSWKAEERAVYVDGGTEGLIQDTSRKAIVRNDNNAILGYHSEKYVGHDYDEWLVERLDHMVGGRAQYANAGLLKNGAVAWVQIEAPENVEITGGVLVRPFILATTSFDGSIATTYKRGFTNVVCDNTMAMFLAESGQTYKRKHTKNSEFDILTAASAMETLDLIAEQTAKQIEAMLSVEVNDSAWSRFVEAHAPMDDNTSKRSASMATTKREALTGLWRTDMRVAPWAGTAWGVVQAVNTYNEHMAIVRNVVREERKMTRAVKDEIAPADRETVSILGKVLDRDLFAMMA